MRNLTALIDEYLTKVANFSHYQQIINLQKASAAMNSVVNQAAKEKSADPKISALVSAIANRASALATNAYTYGITAPVSAKYRNEIAGKVEELNSYLNGKEFNPYDNSVYSLVTKSLDNVQEVLTSYIPSNLAPQKPQEAGETPPGFLPAGQPKMHDSNKFEFPMSQNELETWPTPEREGVTTLEHVTPAGEAYKQEEKPKFNFHPKPGASGYVPGSEKPTFNAEPITSNKGASRTDKLVALSKKLK